MYLLFISRITIVVIYLDTYNPQSPMDLKVELRLNSCRNLESLAEPLAQGLHVLGIYPGLTRRVFLCISFPWGSMYLPYDTANKWTPWVTVSMLNAGMLRH